jgi:gamma-glutamyltranspeptidase
MIIILAKGGNGFDAAVATAFSQMVSDPFMCTIGGMGTLHYYGKNNSGQRTKNRGRIR